MNHKEGYGLSGHHHNFVEFDVDLYILRSFYLLIL